MIDIDFNKVDLAFPKVLTKKLNALKKAITEVIDDGNAKLDATYSSKKIMELVAEFGFAISVVDALPTKGKNNTIYLIPVSEEVHEYTLLYFTDGNIIFYGIETTPDTDYKIGDIIKPTVENTDSGIANRYGVISSVGPDFCESEEGEGLIGVTGTIPWQKDHYYEITDIVDLKGAVTGNTLGKAFIFNEYSGTPDPSLVIECEKLPGCFLYKQAPSKDIKDEYIWVNSQWEKIGSTRVDMSQYYTKDETNTLLDKKADKVLPEPLKFVATQANSSVGIVNNGTGQAPNIEISTDGGVTWTTWDYSTIPLNSGGSVLMRGMNPEGFSKSNNQYSTFTTTGSIGVYGNIMSLIDYTQTVDIIPCNYCFYSLFIGCTSITKAPELPATTLTNNCYSNMFKGCTSLTTAPTLPATTLANQCYDGMFSGCSSLVYPPELPATTLSEDCYYCMFLYCTSLVYPPELPATTLANGCYYGMFRSCKNLIIAPELNATSLADYCYWSMFIDCTNLIKAPVLPATDLVNYCYTNMFKGCSNLHYIKCLAGNNITNNTTDWVSGVPSTGTFVKDPESSWPSGISGIPSGWTVVNHYDDVALENKLTTKVESSSITTIWSGTQAQYDEITTKSDNILYIIK